MLLRMLVQQKVISEKGRTLGLESLASYINFWLSGLLQENGDDVIVLEISPSLSSMPPEFIEDLH